MQLNGSTIWAISASAIALLLAGILIGQSLQQQGPTAAASAGGHAVAESSGTQQATEPDAEPVVDSYQVPDWLQQAPMEWRSEHDGSRDGYAILLDYENRSLLVERCYHPGYFDTEANRPRGNAQPACTRELNSQLLEFTEDGAKVVSKEGKLIEIRLVTYDSSDSAKLELGYDDHHMTLVPGQPNDLMKDIMTMPQMKAEYEQLFEFRQQQVKQQRAQINSGQEEIPRFTVPASVMEQNESLREANRQNRNPGQRTPEAKE